VLDALRQGMNAQHIDEDADALALEVDRVRKLGAAADAEIAPPGQRRLLYQRIARHRAQEEGALPRDPLQQPALQVGHQFLAPVKRTEVEEDAGIEQGLRLGHRDPAGKALLPFVEREAPLGLPAMMFPLQRGKPQASSASFTAAAKGRNRRRSSFRLAGDAAAKYDAVVLIGDQGLFQATLRAEDHPAPGHVGQFEFGPRPGR
jgi:hypothetical protein